MVPRTPRRHPHALSKEPFEGTSRRRLAFGSGVAVMWHVVVKELLQLRHDRRMIPLVLIAPVIQILAFGYAVNTDVRDVPTLLVDRDRSAASRELWDAFAASGHFHLAGATDDPRDVEAWLVRGKAQIALHVASGFGEAVASGGSPAVQVIVDGSDAATTQVALAYASAILAREGRRLAIARLGPLPGRTDLEPRIWYNPDLRSRWFYVPAILAMVLLLVTMILSAMAVVREKEIGTMEQLIVTPIRPWQLLVGKLLPFAAIGLFDTLLVTAVAVFWFEVPLRGSLVLLLLLTGLFLLCTLGLGLLVSTVVRTQQQAMMGAAFLLMVPMIYLSGLIFPIENMPRPIQAVTYAIPLRYYAVVLRGVFLKGSGIGVLWPEALALAGFGAGIMAVAAMRFRKRLD